jgi:iron complex transport system ATP-binding protein
MNTGLMNGATTTRTPALRTRDLAVGYRTRGSSRAVLERVNLSVEPGELVCLLGPNGIGKSTLLRTLGRMQPALWGSIELGGAALSSLSANQLARRLGVVLTERVLVDALSVRRVVEFGRYPHSGWLGRLSQRDREVVEWALDASGARRLADRDFSRLSDGERQRVMIARALAQEPVMLMLDEPTAFLDVPARVELMGLLRQLTRGDAGIAVVVSTHDLDLALRTADIIWLLVPGGEVITGSPEDVAISGAIAQAFEGRQIRFQPESLSFRWLTGDRGTAVVRGHGLPGVMGRAVLEREGFAVVADHNASDAHASDLSASGPNPSVTVAVSDRGWRLRSSGGDESCGETFQSLAIAVRRQSILEHQQQQEQQQQQE